MVKENVGKENDWMVREKLSGTPIGRTGEMDGSALVNSSHFNRDSNMESERGSTKFRLEDEFGAAGNDGFEMEDNSNCAPTIELKVLVRECDAVCKVLESPSADWTDRVSALERLCTVADQGGPHHEEFLAYLQRLKDPMVNQIKDLRSSIVKEACHTVGSIAKAFQLLSYSGGSLKTPSGWAALALVFVENCLKQTPVTIKVISESAEQCIHTVVECLAPLGSPKVLSLLCSSINSKAGQIRLVSVDSLAIALQKWTAFSRSTNATKRWTEVRDSLKQYLSDSDEQVRKSARYCFWAFHSSCKELADQLMKSLDDASQRRISDVRPRTPTQRSSPEKAIPMSFPNRGHAGQGRSSEPAFVSGAQNQSFDASSHASERMESLLEKTFSPNSVQDGPVMVGTAGGPLKLRAVRVQRSSDTSNDASVHAGKREYHPGDYVDGSSASARNKLGGPTRRLTGPQRVASRPLGRNSSVGKSPSLGGQGQASIGGGSNVGPPSSRSLGGGAIRVEFPAEKGSLSTTSSASRPEQQPVNPPQRMSTPSSSGNRQSSSVRSSSSTAASSSDPFNVSIEAPSNSELDRLLTDLESSSHWSTRQEAAIALLKSEHSISLAFASKMAPILCERASDPHHRVVVAVLKAICTFLPKYTKEFGDYLKFLLPALLVGLSDSKATINRYSNEALNLCSERFSADQLCSVLSSICRRKGDKLRQGCVEFLTQIVPKSTTYFSNPMYVRQLIVRLEPCLLSRKMELRKAAFKLVETVFRFDQRAFASALVSHELTPQLMSLVKKVLAPRVSDLDQLLESALRDPTKTSVNDTIENLSEAGEGDVVDEEENEDEDFAADDKDDETVSHISHSSSIPDTEEMDTRAVLNDIEEGFKDHQFADHKGDLLEDDEPRNALHMISNNQVTEIDHIAYRKSSARKETPQTSREARHNTPRTGHGVDTRKFPTPRQKDDDDIEIRMAAIINDISFGNETEVSRSFERAGELCRLSSSKVSERWVVQLITACVDRMSSQRSLIVRESAVVLLGRLAEFFPSVMDQSVEISFSKLLECYRGESFGLLRSVDLALRSMTLSLDPNRVFAILMQVISTDECALLSHALDLMKVVFGRISTTNLLELLPSVVPILADTFNSKDSGVRRMTMFCFVELHFLVGDHLSPYKRGLTVPQQKLICMYVDRETEKREKL